MTARVRALFTKEFWLDAFERAVKASAGGALTAMSLPAVTDIIGAKVSIPWESAGVAALLAAVFSVLGSVASAPIGGTISPASAAAAPPAE